MQKFNQLLEKYSPKTKTFFQKCQVNNFHKLDYNPLKNYILTNEQQISFFLQHIFPAVRLPTKEQFTILEAHLKTDFILKQCILVESIVQYNNKNDQQRLKIDCKKISQLFNLSKQKGFFKGQNLIANIQKIIFARNDCKARESQLLSSFVQALKQIFNQKQNENRIRNALKKVFNFQRNQLIEICHELFNHIKNKWNLLYMLGLQKKQYNKKILRTYQGFSNLQLSKDECVQYSLISQISHLVIDYIKSNDIINFFASKDLNQTKKALFRLRIHYEGFESSFYKLLIEKCSDVSVKDLLTSKQKYFVLNLHQKTEQIAQIIIVQKTIQYISTSLYSSFEQVLNYYHIFCTFLSNKKYIFEKINSTQIHLFLRPIFKTDYFLREYFQEKQFLQEIYSENKSHEITISIIIEDIFQESTNKYALLIALNILLKSNKSFQIQKFKNIWDLVKKPRNNIQCFILIEFMEITCKMSQIFEEQIQKTFEHIQQIINNCCYIDILKEKIIVSCNYNIKIQNNFLEKYSNKKTYKYGQYSLNFLIQLYKSYEQRYNEEAFFHELKKSFRMQQLIAKYHIILLLNTMTSESNHLQTVKNILQIFPLFTQYYCGQPITFNYLMNSTQQASYFQNHLIPYLYTQYLRILLESYPQSSPSILHYLFSSLHSITLPYSPAFYLQFHIWRSILITVSYSVTSLPLSQLQFCIQTLLPRIQFNNHPLLRQFIQLTLCKLYTEINHRSNYDNKYRAILQQMYEVNINTAIPISLILGYELLEGDGKEEILKHHIQCVGFAGCHTAYLRGICHQHLLRHFQKQPSDDPFIKALLSYLKNDKDSTKMLKNIGRIVDGFHKCMKEKKEIQFIGFERVEEYPSNRVKTEIYRTVMEMYQSLFYQRNYKIVNKVNECIKNRYAFIKNIYEEQTKLIKQNSYYGNNRSNIRNTKNHNDQQIKKKNNQLKNVKNKQTQNNSKIQKPKNNKFFEQNSNVYKQKQQIIEHNLHLSSISTYLRLQSKPQIIIIGSLLQKTHNFGNILRTVHGLNALVTVPNLLSLQHASCQQLLPKDCDAKVIEVKEEEIDCFVAAMRDKYTLIALEQCEKAVMLQKVQFPDRIMLLLGNERKGVPGQLLNKADILIEIPQTGCVRSLNVHVSAVLCIWEYLKSC